MDHDTNQLQGDVDAARVAYQDADGHLMRLTTGIWEDPRAAADGLLEIAEEQGADRAVYFMLGNVEGFGTLSNKATDSIVADASDHIEQALERVLVARDRLDQATAKRETHLRAGEPNRLPVVNFGGREFVIDARQGELRSIDNPAERFRLPDKALDRDTAPVSKPSLTEQIAKDTGIAPAQPSPPRDKTRGR